MMKYILCLCSLLLIGCGGEKAEIEEQSRASLSPLRNLPIPADEEYEQSPTVDIDPILQDSIITLEEREELITMIENLLNELSYYKREFYLQKLRK